MEQAKGLKNISKNTKGSIPMEDYYKGWCLTCTCRPHFHVGAKECERCGCEVFSLDTYREVLDKRNIEMRASYEEAEEFFEIEVSQLEQDVFFGEASRECTSCGDIKLYQEFNDSREPDIICNYCLYECLEEIQTDEEEEYIDPDEEIFENERAKEDAEDRQEMIDAFLRGLDE